jgi:hypothetical protein
MVLDERPHSGLSSYHDQAMAEELPLLESYQRFRRETSRKQDDLSWLTQGPTVSC